MGQGADEDFGSLGPVIRLDVEKRLQARAKHPIPPHLSPPLSLSLSPSFPSPSLSLPLSLSCGRGLQGEVGRWGK